MSIELFQVDAFADRPFAGNAAAVCPLAEPAEPAWMQDLAAEMNLSETAFVTRRGDGFDLRWFTPVAEVDLCGHATLATAHVLWETGRLAPGEAAVFETRSGTLTAERRDDLIEMDFPAGPAAPAEPPTGLLDALGGAGTYVGRNVRDELIAFETDAELRALAPDFTALRRLGDRGFIVTAPAEDDRFDFVSRFFAPAFGIDEDPVTGSAHCCLAPYWRDRLGRDALVGFQASSRGGVVHVRVVDDRVLLGGRAVTVMRAELCAPVATVTAG